MMHVKNNFLNRTKGSITVFVTLIFVPSIFFVALMADLARVKLVGTQAAMTADNYGKAVLTVFDNELKDLYGLFAVSQDEKAVSRLDSYQEYLKSSFNPNSKTVTFEHLVNMGLGSTSYSGMMPYKDAEVQLEYTKNENSKLSTEEIFCTQIGDFMKFRILQTLRTDEKAEKVLKALEKVQETSGTAKAVGKQQELNEEIQNLYDKAWHFYYYAKLFKNLSGRDYMSYIDDVNTALESNTIQIEEIAASDSYQTYYAYNQEDEGAMLAAAEKRERIENSEKDTVSDTDATPSKESTEELTAEEERLLEIYDAYVEDENAHEDTLRGNFEGCIQAIKDAVNNGPVQRYDFDVNDSIDEMIKLESYDHCAKKLKLAAVDVKNSVGKTEELKNEIVKILQTEKMDSTVKANMEKDLELLEEIDKPEIYEQLAECVYSNQSLNVKFKQDSDKYLDKLTQVVESYMNCAGEGVGEHLQLDMGTYNDFYKNVDTKKLYDHLEEMFAKESDDNNETKSKKKEAEQFLEGYENMTLEEETDARNIPEFCSYGYDGISDKLCSIINLNRMSWIANLFSVNGITNELNRLLLKFYLVEYDFGMFSSRITQERIKNGEEVKSLTGYEMNRKLNYLYGAEIEYIFGGYKDSESNLAEARNTVLAFRAVMNFAATYRILEINNAINKFQAPPLTALLVRATLRSGVAAAETYADWEELKQDKSVALIKAEMNDLTSLNKFADLIDLSDDKEKLRNIQKSEDVFSMDYEQYMMVLLTFMVNSSDVASRTQNLIELNMNAAKSNLDSSSTLSSLDFKMDNAYTAVDSTCSVHVNFVVIPEGFMHKVVPDEEESMREYEKRRYRFTVTRGY